MPAKGGPTTPYQPTNEELQGSNFDNAAANVTSPDVALRELLGGNAARNQSTALTQQQMQLYLNALAQSQGVHDSNQGEWAGLESELFGAPSGSSGGGQAGGLEGTYGYKAPPSPAYGGALSPQTPYSGPVRAGDSGIQNDRVAGQPVTQSLNAQPIAYDGNQPVYYSDHDEAFWNSPQGQQLLGSAEGARQGDQAGQLPSTYRGSNIGASLAAAIGQGPAPANNPYAPAVAANDASRQPRAGLLPTAYDTENRANKDSLWQLENTYGNITNPDIANWAGPASTTAAQANPEDIAAQRGILSKLEAQTGTQETAEERLMREMARRKQEGDLKSSREALQNNLRARGVYGSGAEVSGTLAAQQESSVRRALEEMGANARAQQRALAALTQSGNLSTNIRNAGAQESQFNAGQANNAEIFNKQSQEQHNQFKTGQERANNTDTERRAATTYDAQKGTAGQERTNAENEAKFRMGTTAAKTGANTNDFTLQNNATAGLGSIYGGLAAQKAAEADDQFSWFNPLNIGG